MREAFEQAAFAPYAAKPLSWSQACVARGLELPRFHRLRSGENSLWLARCESDKIIDVMEHSRRDENQAVKSVQQTAMTGDQFGGVFETNVPFDSREHEIAELPDYADEDAESD